MFSLPAVLHLTSLIRLAGGDRSELCLDDIADGDYDRLGWIGVQVDMARDEIHHGLPRITDPRADQLRLRGEEVGWSWFDDVVGPRRTMRELVYFGTLCDHFSVDWASDILLQ
jgi:hypothetical protein